MMANSRAVCLLFVAFFCCSDVSLGRQLPKECSTGPGYWCQNLRNAADCGAVGHCLSTVWETTEDQIVTKNDISDKFVNLFEELKDVKDLINEDYLATRVKSACHDVGVPLASKICKQNTAQLEMYLNHVLVSKASPKTMCRIVGMCNNDKLDHISTLSKKKFVEHDVNKPKHKDVLVGANRCTWGPSYWCSNITTGHECKATHHCVERVWSKMEVPEDKDSICQICTDMVKQARDQLESNQTQEDLKAVFDGSCKLIPIKLVAKECIKMADEFVPDLVETLASQMNPQVVCSVAGLCNNAHIDQMLKDYEGELAKRTECNNCHRTVGALRKKFEGSSHDDFLVGMLTACRGLGSLSDSCSMLVFKYYENIVAAVKHDLRPEAVCHVSGQCQRMFHTHADYTFPLDTVHDQPTDEVPCEFCEQLVKHFRDVMVANTTELQFYKVLQGLCKQSGNFKTECTHLVEEYYPVIYNYMVSDLDPKQVCALLGVCENSDTVRVPIAPLLPEELTVRAITPSSKLIGTDEANSEKLSKQASVRIVGQEASAALPIERMFVSLPRSGAVCSFCQYFLHYLQLELSDSNTEEKIKAAVEKACDHLPNSVRGQCEQFVTEYGPSVIALLVQEIDPADVCPALGACPQLQAVRRVSINEDKSNCPLCLFAVEQLETMLKNNRTEASIRQALDNLCTHLSQKLRTECTDFVDTYSNQLVEMLIADLNSQEICVYLKLCTDNTKKSDPLKLSYSSRIDMYHERPESRGDYNHFKKSPQPKYTVDGDIETNEIPDHTSNGRPVVPHLKKPKTACIVCEFVMNEIDEQIKDKHNEDDFKNIVHGVCKRLPKSVKSQCDEFVERYADLVISLLEQKLEPSAVCRELKLCPQSQAGVHRVKEAVLDCAVCETVVAAVKKVLNNDKADRSIVHIVEKSCALLPAKYVDRCHTMMEIYGDSVIHLIEEFGAKGVCQKIGLCAARSGRLVDMYKEQRTLH